MTSCSHFFFKGLRILCFPLRMALYPVRRLDDFMVGLMLRDSQEQVLHGSCKKRGVCCHRIVIQFPLWAKYRPLRWVVQLWYFLIYNFSMHVWEGGNGQGVFRCDYLKGGLCSIYSRRPRICRDYPHRSVSGRPQLLPGCGYEFKPGTKAD